ncbi:MAG TPA: ribosome maturation factor RimP [Kofleriaceae bacterium]|nr:ribosome maturation factor RimP [Kofleriaceae bacterium]
MKSASEISRDLFAIAEPACRANGYELVEVEYTTSQSGWVVRIYIDRQADIPDTTGIGPIGLDDCERMSRELSALFDVEDPLKHAYGLEVSSPGIDRPLRTAAHFQRYAGQVAKVLLAQPLGERKNFKGVIGRVDDDGTHVTLDVDGTEFRLPLADIGSARLVPDWDALLKAKAPRKESKKKRTG